MNVWFLKKGFGKIKNKFKKRFWKIKKNKKKRCAKYILALIKKKGNWEIHKIKKV
jgi:hypothetical protein